MISTSALITFQVLVFWPVWGWYARRLTDGSDEPWGIVALLAAVSIGALRGRRLPPPRSSLFSATGVVLVYAILYRWLPFLGRGLLCVTTLSLILSPVLYGKRMQSGLMGLLVLSLPLIASLQFFGGFPIRFLTAHLSAGTIGLFGYPVQARGTLMVWFGEVIAVDAPCAGIKMLWSELLVNFCLAAWFNRGLATTWIATSLTLACVFAGNVLRASLLFFVESGIVRAPDWAHLAIGMMMFLIVTMAVVLFHLGLQRRYPECAI